MNADHTRQLYDYSHWAYRQVWTCIDTLTDEQFTHENGYSYGSLRNHFVHVLSAEAVWLARLKGMPRPPAFDPVDYPTRADVPATWAEVEAAWREYLATLTDADLEERITYPKEGGVRHDQRWQIIAHVINHGTDHRAQMLMLLWQMGAPTVEQDFPLYFWSHEAT